MARALVYLASCVGVGAVLWLMADTAPAAGMQALWFVAWMLGVVVTWKVARRDGLNPLGWVVVTLLVGPLAWVLMAALAVRRNSSAS